MPKSIVIGFRAGPETQERLHQLAEWHGSSPADVLRFLIHRACEAPFGGLRYLDPIGGENTEATHGE